MTNPATIEVTEHAVIISVSLTPRQFDRLRTAARAIGLSVEDFAAVAVSTASNRGFKR